MSMYHSLIDYSTQTVSSGLSHQKSRISSVTCHTRQSSSESEIDEFDYSTPSSDEVDDGYVDPYLFGSDEDTAEDDESVQYTDVKRAYTLPLQMMTPITGPEALCRSSMSVPSIVESDEGYPPTLPLKRHHIQHQRSRSITADDWARDILNSTDPSLYGKQQHQQQQQRRQQQTIGQELGQTGTLKAIASMPAIERNSGAYSFNDSQFYDKEHHNLQDPADLLVTKLAELRSASDTDLYNAIESLQSVRRTQSQRQPSSPQLGLAHQQHNTFPTGRYPQHNLPSHVSLEIHQLRIQNAYLAHHNRIITREISQAKCTSHALRTVCLQKERAISRLQDDLMSALDRTRSLEKTVADLKMEIEHRRPPPMPSRKIKRSSMSSLALDNLTGGWFRNRRRSVDDYVVEGGRRVGVEISTSPRSSDDSTYDAACHYGRHSLDATRDTDRVNNVRKITRKTGDGHRRIFSGSSSSTSASLVSSLESTAEDESLVLDSDQIRRAINSSNINGANELSDRMTESSNHRGFRRRMKAMLKSSSNLNNSKSMLSIFRAGSSSNLKRRSKGDSHESFFNDLNQRRHCQLENSI